MSLGKFFRACFIQVRDIEQDIRAIQTRISPRIKVSCFARTIWDDSLNFFCAEELRELHCYESRELFRCFLVDMAAADAHVGPI